MKEATITPLCEAALCNDQARGRSMQSGFATIVITWKKQSYMKNSLAM